MPGGSCYVRKVGFRPSFSKGRRHQKDAVQAIIFLDVRADAGGRCAGSKQAPQCDSEVMELSLLDVPTVAHRAHCRGLTPAYPWNGLGAVVRCGLTTWNGMFRHPKCQFWSCTLTFMHIQGRYCLILSRGRLVLLASIWEEPLCLLRIMCRP